MSKKLAVGKRKAAMAGRRSATKRELVEVGKRPGARPAERPAKGARRRSS